MEEEGVALSTYSKCECAKQLLGDYRATQCLISSVGEVQNLIFLDAEQDVSDKEINILQYRMQHSNDLKHNINSIKVR